MVLVPALIFLGASIVLVKSASYGVKSVSKLAEEMRFSRYFIAFVIAGLVSTLPELFIGINSALIGMPSVGLRTLIGSNITDMTLVLGLVVLVGRKMPVDRKTISNSVYFVAVAALPIILMLDGNLSRDDGLLLVMVFFVYLYIMIKKEKAFVNKEKRKKKKIAKHLIFFVISIVALFVSAHYMVQAGISIATEFAMPALLIGLIVISLGTSLPELTFSLRAAIGKHKEIALGDLMGNVVVDSTLSMGIVAIIYPITNNFVMVISGAMFMILSVLVVVTLIKAGRKLLWQEAFLLLFIYAMFIAIELLIKGTIAH
jgi:cation:H+ antiporter